jgi:hypothetical protein
MSSFINKIGALANKAVSDPEAEKAYRDQQAASKATIKYYERVITSGINELKQAVLQKSLYPADEALIEEAYTAGSTYLSGATNTEADDIKQHMDNELHPWEDFYNIAIAPQGPRFILWRFIDTCKQALRDNQTISPANSKQLNDLIQQTTAFLNDNVKSPSSLYQTYIQTTITARFTNNPNTDKDLVTIYGKAAAKVAKNAGLDFHEGDTLPDNATEAQKAAAAAEAEKQKDTFSMSRLFGNAAKYTITIASITIGIFICMIGSSMAVNLNVYKSYPYKILYAIFGFIFSLVVIPYVIGYRWLYKGKKPRYYGFLPFIPQYFTNYYIQILFGWLTYRPDEHMWDLQEWRQVAAVMKLANQAS